MGDEFFNTLDELISHHDIATDRKEKFEIPIMVGIQVEMKFMEYFSLNTSLENMNEGINENINHPTNWYTKKLEPNDEDKLEKIIGNFLLERLGKIPFHQVAREKEHILTIENGSYVVTGEYLTIR